MIDNISNTLKNKIETYLKLMGSICFWCHSLLRNFASLFLFAKTVEENNTFIFYEVINLINSGWRQKTGKKTVAAKWQK